MAILAGLLVVIMGGLAVLIAGLYKLMTIY